MNRLLPYHWYKCSVISQCHSSRCNRLLPYHWYKCSVISQCHSSRCSRLLPYHWYKCSVISQCRSSRCNRILCYYWCTGVVAMGYFIATGAGAKVLFLTISAVAMEHSSITETYVEGTMWYHNVTVADTVRFHLYHW